MEFERNAGGAGFRVDGLIGAGGSGTVYRATQVSTDLPVALKVLRPGIDPARLRREADLLARVAHRGVARLLGVYRIGADDVLAVEWIEGRSLASVMREDGKLTTGRATAIFEQIADALSAVHEAGVVHRDVSPANVLITDDDRAVLIDFGISTNDSAATVTAEGSLAGTPRYLAPEVIEGADSTPASDQYSAAIVFYEMLSGRWPFAGGDTVANVLHAQLSLLPTPLTEVDPGQSVTVDAAITRALGKKPEQRHPSMLAFRSALAQPPNDPQHAGPQRLSGTATIGLIVLGALVVLGAAGGWLLNRGDPADEVAVAVSNDVAPTTPPSPVPPTAVSASPIPATAVPATAVPATAVPATAVPTSEVQPTTAPDVETIEAVSVTGIPVDEVSRLGDVAIQMEIDPLASGTAGALGCNKLTQNDFESSGIEENFFGHPDTPNRERVIAGAGVDGSAGLEVGDPDGFGKYAQAVEIEPGRVYLFSAHVRTEGDVFDATISIDWLSEDWVGLDLPTSKATIAGRDGQFSLRSAPAPAEARYALPVLFKDSSPGLLFADELVFAVAGAGCDELLLSLSTP